MKRVLAILMALVMLFSMAACTGSDDDDGSMKLYEYTTGYDETKYNAPGTLPVFKEKQTIEVMLPDSQYVTDWDTNTQTLFYEQDLNADLVFDVLPSSEYKTKINLMAASGGEEYKDVILGSFSNAMLITLADSEVIVPITEYMYNTDVAYYSNEAKERLGWDYYPFITMPDGEIYAIPRLNEAISNVSDEKMWFYKPWFDKAGIELTDIKTPEDFKNALLTVVKSDPNGNGKNDEIGITSSASSHEWRNYIMNAFVYAGGPNFMYVEDGEVGFAYQTEEWKEGLTFIKELYDLGLIDPLAFSQDSAGFKSMQNYNETIVTAFAGLGAGGIADSDVRRVEYECVPPLNSKWNDGKPLSSETLPAPAPRFVVSLNCDDVETAFRFGDYMVSEKMSIHTRWGEKGVDWLLPDEDDKSMYESLGYEPYLIEVTPFSIVQNQQWIQTGPYIRQKAISAGVVWSGNPLDYNVKIAEGQLLYEGTGPEENIVILNYTEAENEITSEGLANLNTYVNEMASKFITGTEDIETGWDAFQNQLKTMNVEEVLECAQAAYDRMLAVAGK